MVPPASRRSRSAVIVSSFLAVAAAIAPRAFGAAEFIEKHPLENSAMKIVLAKVRQNPTATTAILAVKNIDDLATDTRFKTIYSPVWSVELRNYVDPANNPPITVPPNPVDSIFLPLDKTEIIDDSPTQCRMLWHEVPVPGLSQTLEVEVTVKLRPDLKSEWDIHVSATGGDYAVYAVRFPYFALDLIERDGTTDRIVTPFGGGMKLREPLVHDNDFPERDATEGSVRDAFFTYPGQMFTQFMAYYDPLHAGLYMQAEDKFGTMKNLYFDSADSFLRPDERRFYFYFTHFNQSPSIASGASAAARRAELLRFDLKREHDYPMVVTTFAGDWQEAASIYRSWVTGSNVPFVERGSLADRADLAASLKQTAYAFRYQLPDDPVAVDPLAEYAKVQRLLSFYDDVFDRFDPARQRDLTPLVLLSRYNVDETTGGVFMGVPGDDHAEPIRSGVPEFIARVRFPASGGLPVREIALNRDTTGFEIGGLNETVALEKGVMRNSLLEPMQPDAEQWRSCLGSSWLRTHRTDVVLQTMADSMFMGQAGFTMAAVSGDGNFSFPCFAPALSAAQGVDPVAHDHPVGGGRYLSTGWLSFGVELRQRALAELGINSVLMGMEHEPETMITQFVLNGRSFTDPYDDSAPGIGRTITDSVPIPLFRYLYHDYNLWPGKVPPFTKVIDTYVDGTHPLGDLLLLRYRIGQLAMLGRLQIVQVSQQPEFATYEALPDDLPPELQDEHRYFAAMAVLRAGIPEFLIFGRSLRDPVVTPLGAADSVAMRTIWKGVETTQDVPRVLASGWSDDRPGGYTGLILTNFTPQAAAATFAITPADYGLSPGVAYRIERKSYQFPWSDTGWTVNGSDSAYVSPPIVVPPFEDLLDEPWRLYRFVPVGP